jgi:hypothetical protein
MSQEISFSIVAGYELDCRCSNLYRLQEPRSLLSCKYRATFFREEIGRSLKLTTHFHLVPRLRKRVSTPHLLRTSS